MGEEISLTIHWTRMDPSSELSIRLIFRYSGWSSRIKRNLFSRRPKRLQPHLCTAGSIVVRRGPLKLFQQHVSSDGANGGDELAVQRWFQGRLPNRERIQAVVHDGICMAAGYFT